MDACSAKCFHFTLILLIVLLFFSAPAIGSESSVIAPLAPRSLLLDAQRVENALIAVGERGHVLISEDGGDSWEQIQVPTRATLTGVYFIDRAHGWVVGHDQVILRTQDGGKSWELVYEDAAAESPLLDVYFKDAQQGLRSALMVSSWRLSMAEAVGPDVISVRMIFI